MRASVACLLLLLRCSGAVRLGRQQQEGEPLVCRATCQQKGLGSESRSCPFANYLEYKYYYWKHYRGCDAESQRIDLSCGDLQPGGYAKEIEKQLKGKHVVMIGDSTMRQTYIGLLCLLWEEGLVRKDIRPLNESREERMSKENKGMIVAQFPELSDTKFTYIRKDWGQPGPMMQRILDTADITVANMAMHYNLAVGANVHRTADTNVEHTIYYDEDVTRLISEMIARGRPGHRAFWREALVCPMYDAVSKPDTNYGCVDKPNPSLRRHNDVVAKLPGVDHLSILPVAEMFMRFWWAHPGGHDCCHMVGRVPGLLSSVSRMFIAMLAHPEAKGVEIERSESFCPTMEERCAEKILPPQI